MALNIRESQRNKGLYFHVAGFSNRWGTAYFENEAEMDAFNKESGSDYEAQRTIDVGEITEERPRREGIIYRVHIHPKTSLEHLEEQFRHNNPDLITQSQALQPVEFHSLYNRGWQPTEKLKRGNYKGLPYTDVRIV